MSPDRQEPPDLRELDREQFCYLTTTGRVSGRPHEIEIWFGREGATLYLLSGGGERSDWVRNLIADPAVEVRVGPTTWRATARVVDDAAEDASARRLLLERYAPTYAGDLGDWGARALPVALDLDLRRAR